MFAKGKNNQDARPAATPQSTQSKPQVPNQTQSTAPPQKKPTGSK